MSQGRFFPMPPKKSTKSTHQATPLKAPDGEIHLTSGSKAPASTSHRYQESTSRTPIVGRRTLRERPKPTLSKKPVISKRKAPPALQDTTSNKKVQPNNKGKSKPKTAQSRPPPSKELSPPSENPFDPKDLDQFLPLGPEPPPRNLSMCHEYGESDYENDTEPIANINNTNTNNSRNYTTLHPPKFVPLQGSRLQTFNRYSNRADLDDHHLAMGRQLCSITEVRKLATSKSTAVGTPAAAAPWLSKDDSAELRDGIMSNPDKWKKRLLPRGYGKNPKVADAKSLNTLVNVVLKELLENIHLPGQTGSTGTGAIPTLNGVVARLHDKEFGQVGGRVPVCDEIFEQVGHLQKARYAYIRMQACHWGFYKADYKDGATLWGIVDEKLEYLRSRSSRYRHAFAILCLSEDLEVFGNNKPLNINETWGSEVPEDELLHKQDERQAEKEDDNDNIDNIDKNDEEEEEEDEKEEEEEEDEKEEEEEEEEEEDENDDEEEED
ncbi:uncharacterized protein MELLADRAFT_85943 [Melampsora larici-populina 98AG31]|uniref:Uncharacterized protein n=1 Tax=Melampsora larici-populina (strain 98AG31 / pathotype 3-4-7) TaxID=747676 RepID=F4RK83_MELLP|nr:uncharacterized protein MELLADRAFT_85943 [Melampsora larici-populina 98AG31]EGG07229.1 hypothetical protein MELLADRAFT_85943 [Melampsora larici-populina 98AG31]